MTGCSCDKAVPPQSDLDKVGVASPDIVDHAKFSQHGFGQQQRDVATDDGSLDLDDLITQLERHDHVEGGVVDLAGPEPESFAFLVQGRLHPEDFEGIGVVLQPSRSSDRPGAGGIRDAEQGVLGVFDGEHFGGQVVAHLDLLDVPARSSPIVRTLAVLMPVTSSSTS